MGRVYLAEDEVLGRRAAVKVISERVAGEELARKRFLREARAMATVEHPNVVRVYSFGEAGGAAYLVMEYVEGEVLSARLRREGALPPAEAVRVARQVVDALEAAWEKGLVHRDIKPSNILLDARGQVRVADFGLARAARSDGDPALTESGAFLGTPHYASPEQARGQDVDFRADVYSLGIVLYEMLAGGRPFEGTSPFDVAAKQISAPLPSLDARRPGLPTALVRLVGVMAEKDPAHRPPSYAALRVLLDTACAGPPTGPPAGEVGSPVEPPLRPRRAAAAAFLGLALLGGLWHASKQAPGATAPPPEGLVVAVTPFHGPDEESAREGRVMAALVERAIAQKLPGGVKVLGVEETGPPVRGQEEAQRLGGRLGATIVVWGEAFVLKGETEVQPAFTLVTRRKDKRLALDDRNPPAALGQSAAETLVMGAAAPNQIELRKTGAAGVGDLVVLLAGVHALRVEDSPQRALELFSQAPRSPQSLRCRSEALAAQGKPEEALGALEDAAALDPADAQTWAALCDLHAEAARLPDAVAACRRAAGAAGTWTSRRAALFEGKLYVAERFRRIGEKGETADSGYLLALDPQTGAVRERHRLPGFLASLRVVEGGLQVASRDGWWEDAVDDTFVIRGGQPARPLSLGWNMHQRRLSGEAGQALAANFLPRSLADRDLAPRGERADLPRTFPELEAALRRARETDPTQPWHVFFLGQAAFWQKREAEADALWAEMLVAEYPATPYYEYSWMASLFENLGQPGWADRAFAEALARRKRLPQAVGTTTVLERLVGARFIKDVAERGVERRGPPDQATVDRDHLWLARARQLGLSMEADDLAAAAWAAHYAARGDPSRAAEELAVRDAARFGPLNWAQVAARLDGLRIIQLSLGCAFFLTFGTFLVIARARRRASQDAGRWLLAWLSPADRLVLLAAAATSLLSYLPVAAQLQAMSLGPARVPIGIGDALDSAAMIGRLERDLAERPSAAGRFVLGVANQIAGRTDRARELYAALGDDERATRNLAALRAGSRVPPEPIRPEDLAAFLGVRMGEARLRAVLDVPRLEKDMGMAGTASFPLALATLLVGLGLAAGLVLVPARPGGSPVPAVAPAWASRLLPGVGDLDAGRSWRAGYALASTAFVVVVCASHAWYNRAAEVPAFGSATAGMKNVARWVILPPEPSRWAMYWAYADAPWLWGAVVLAACAAVGLHLTRPRPAVATTPVGGAGGTTVPVAADLDGETLSSGNVARANTPEDRTRSRQ